MFHRTTATMPARTTGGSGASTGQAILAAQSAFFQQQQQQQQQHHNSSGNNGGSDYMPDRPIGYGAFGVVWSVTDPRDGKRVALKKLPNVFQSLVSSKRVFRELKMMRFSKHENVLSCLDILQPPHIDFFHEIYMITELMQSDLHKIIVSPQHLSQDHIKYFSIKSSEASSTCIRPRSFTETSSLEISLSIPTACSKSATLA